MTPYQKSYTVPTVLDGEEPFQLKENQETLFNPAFEPNDILLSSKRTSWSLDASQYSWHTKVKSRTKNPNNKCSVSFITELKQKVEDVFKKTGVMEQVALIAGCPVLLRTNSLHLWNFWSRNWYLGYYDEVYERLRKNPIMIYAAMGVRDSSGELLSPGAYFCPETREIVFVNTDYYGQCKSWALGAAGIWLAKFGIHSIHGACVEIEQRGVLIIAPTGTGKSTYTNELAQRGFINSDDWVYVGEEGKNFFAYPSERNIYVRSNAVQNNPEHGGSVEKVLSDPVMRKQFEIFEQSPAENVPLVDGKRAYDAVPNSRVMIDPCQISPMSYKSPLSVCFLLRRDPKSPFLVKLAPESAVEILQKGEYMISPGTTDDQSKWGTLAYESWYNPYLLQPDPKFETERFLAMFRGGVTPYILNTHSDYAEKFPNGDPDTKSLIKRTADILLSCVMEEISDKNF